MCVIRADWADRRPIDGGGLSGLACRSRGRARSAREEAADVRCGSGSWGSRCPSPGDYVPGTGLRGERAVPEGANVAYALALAEATIAQPLDEDVFAWTPLLGGP